MSYKRLCSESLIPNSTTSTILLTPNPAWHPGTTVTFLLLLIKHRVLEDPHSPYIQIWPSLSIFHTTVLVLTLMLCGYFLKCPYHYFPSEAIFFHLSIIILILDYFPKMETWGFFWTWIEIMDVKEIWKLKSTIQIWKLLFLIIDIHICIYTKFLFIVIADTSTMCQGLC